MFRKYIVAAPSKIVMTTDTSLSMLHVRVIQAINLPKMDERGHCDGYCVLSVGEQKFQTRIIQNARDPYFRQDFHFKVDNFATDRLLLTIYDHDKMSKDDKICDLELLVKQLPSGVVTDQLYTMRPIIRNASVQVRLLVHFARAKDTPFLTAPFDVYNAHVRIIEYQSQKVSDYRCTVQLADQTVRRTSKISDTKRAIFEEEFSMLISDFATDTIKIETFSSKGLLGKVEVPVTKYEIGKVVKEWFDVEEGKLRVAFHIAPYTMAAFAGEEWDALPPIENTLELHVRLIGAEGLPNADADGASDPYCLLHISTDEKNKHKSRVIKDNCSPKWNQHFQFHIRNLAESDFVLAVYDYDGKGNADDKLGDYRVPVRSLKYGVTEDKVVPLKGKSGTVHIVTYLGICGSTPFVDQPFAPYYLGVTCVEAMDVPKMDTFGLSDPYCTMRLSIDDKKQKTDVMENTVHPIWDHRLLFIVLTLDGVTLDIEMYDQDPGADELISVGTVGDLQRFLAPEGQNIWVEMTPAKGVKKGGRVHLCVKMSQNEADVFNNMNFTHEPDPVKPPKEKKEKKHKDKKEKSKHHKDKKSRHHKSGRSGRRHRQKEQFGEGSLATEPFPEGVTLFLTLVGADGIPAMDSNGLSDPYVVFKIKDRKGKEKSSIMYETLTPTWNEQFKLNVFSYDDDVLEIKMMDYDKVGKDDKIGTCELPIHEMVTGQPHEQVVVMDTVKRVQARVFLRYYFAVPSPENAALSTFYIPTSAHLRVVRGENLKTSNAMVKAITAKGLRFHETRKVEGTSPTWNEDFRFTLTGPGDHIKLTLVDTVKSKENVVGSATVSGFGAFGEILERSVDINGGKIYFVLDHEPYGVPSKLPVVQQSGFLCPSMMLNVRIIGATDIEAMDKNGKSDPYIVFWAKGRETEKQKTKVISKTLAPVWNEEFHIPIKSIQTDTIHFEMKDHDDIGKDDSISFYDFVVSTLSFGTVDEIAVRFHPEKKVKKPGIVKMVFHLCNAGMYAFYPFPFNPLMVHVLVEEAKDLANMDVGGKSDPYCKVSLSNDVTAQKTRVIDNSLTPQWFEQFSFMITSMEDFLNILVRDEDRGKDEDMANLQLPLVKFPPGYVIEQWYPLTPCKSVKRGGEIKLKVHIAERGVTPFDGYIPPVEPERAGDVCEVQVDLIRARALPGLDAGGKSDPYCRLTLLDQPGEVKSRIIDSTCDPHWNQKLRMPVMSLRTDILRIEVMDHDKHGKDDQISLIDFPLRELQWGVTNRGTFQLTPLHGRSKGGSLEMAVQVTQPGQVPFVDQPFSAYVLNCRIVGTSGLPESDLSHLQCKVKMEKDSRPLLSSIKNNCSNAVWNEDFQLTVTNHTKDSLVVAVENTAKKEIVGEGSLSIAGFLVGKTQELDIDLKPAGKIHVYVQLAMPTDVPYADIGLRSAANSYMTLYVKVLEGEGIPKMDKNGLADPYCALSLAGRKDVKKTEVLKKTLTPAWNQEFQFPIVSYGTDVFHLALYDHDDTGRDDKIGETRIVIKDMDPGMVSDRVLELGYKDGCRPKIHVVMHLAAANQPKFENMPFRPDLVWVKVCEAMDIAKVDRIGKSDPYIEVGMLSDIATQHTKHLDNTLTPQWYEEFSFYVTNYDSDILKFLMKDEGSTRDSKMASLELPLSQFERCSIYEEWFDMTPAGNVKVGGKLKLQIQISPQDVGAWTCPMRPKPPLPAASGFELVVKLIEATSVPVMDVKASDPYVVLNFPGQMIPRYASRVIDNTTHPIWNEVARMPVPNINQTVLDITLMDKDEMSKDDYISYATIPLRDIKPGVVYNEKRNLTRWRSTRNGGVLSMIYQLLAPGMVPFVEQPFDLYEAHVHLSTVSGFPSVETDYFCEVKVTNDVKPTPTIVANRVVDTAQFEETSHFLLRGLDLDCIEVRVLKHEKTGKVIKPSGIANFSLPLNSFELLKVHEHVFTSQDGKLTARALVQIRKQGEPGFVGIELPKRQPYVDTTQRLINVQIVSAQGLPMKDSAGGRLDPYCKVTLERRKKVDQADRFVGLTRVIPWCQNPVFKQIFHVPIKCIDNDVLKITVYTDNDDVLGSSKIQAFVLNMQTMGKGVVKTHELKTAKGTLTVITHVSDFGQPSFIDNPFQLQRLNVQVKEAIDIPKGDVGSRTDGYCVLRLNGSVSSKRTKVINDSQTPQWFQDFSFLLNSAATDSLHFTLFDEDQGKDQRLAQFTLATSNYQIGYVYDDWYPLKTPQGADAGQLRLKVHIGSETDAAFSGQEIHKPSPEPSEIMELHIKVLEGMNIKSKDIGDPSDPYATFELLGYPESLQKTRVIDNTRNPKWDQIFRIPLVSLNSDVLAISLWDRDIRTKDDFLGSRTILLKALQAGHVYDEWLEIGTAGKIHLIYHLTRGGGMPFEEAPFTPLQVHVHIGELTGSLGVNDPYIGCWINEERRRTPTVNQKSLVWNEQFDFIVTNPVHDVLHFAVYDNETNAQVHDVCEKAQFSASLSQINFGTPQTLTLENDKGCKLVVVLQTTELGQPGFQGLTLPPRPANAWPVPYLHVHIVEATNVPSTDRNGLSDPYVKLQLGNRTKKSESPFPAQFTRYITRTLCPFWNHVFHIELLSYADDELTFKLFDRDAQNKDDRIGKVSLAVRTLPPGVVKEETLRLGGAALKVLLHVADSNQPAFVNHPFTMYDLNIRVREAKSIPDKMKNDARCRMRLEKGTQYSQTSKRSGTNNPQWFENFSFPLTSIQGDALKVLMCDDRDPVDSFTIRPSEYEIGKTVCKSFKLDKHQESELSLLVQVNPRGEAAFADYSEPYQQITCDDVTLHITVVEADGLPSASDVKSAVDEDTFVSIGLQNSSCDRVRTRAIENSRKPVWNEEFHLTIPSIVTSIVDFNVCYKSDSKSPAVVGSVVLPIKTLARGMVIDNWYDVFDKDQNRARGRVHLRLHLANAGQPSYEEKPWDPQELHVQIKTVGDLRKSLPHPDATVYPLLTSELLNDGLAEFGHILGTEMSDYFRHQVTTLNTSLKVSLADLKYGQTALSSFGEISFPLEGLTVDQVQTHKVKCGKSDIELEISMCLKPFAAPPAFPFPTAANLMIPSPKEEGYRVFLRFNEISDSARYICCAQLDGNPAAPWRYALVHGRPAMPPFVFFDVKSVNSETLQIQVFPLPPTKGELWEKPVLDYKCLLRDLPMGGVEDRCAELEGPGALTFTLHLAPASRAPFAQELFAPMALNVHFIEAVGVPSMDRGSKSDCFFRVRLESDVPNFWRQTRTIDDSLTPQWNERVQLLLTNPQDKFTIEMCDEDAKKAVPISSYTFQLQDFNNGQPVSQWVRLAPAKDVRKGGAANVAIQVAPMGHEVDLAAYVVEAIPEEYADMH